MDNEFFDIIEPLLLPIVIMDDDVEKGFCYTNNQNSNNRNINPNHGTSSTTALEPSPSSSNGLLGSSSNSIVVRGTRIRLKILGIIAVTVIPVFAVMVVLLMSVLVVYCTVKLPDIFLIGNLTGTVNATLGTLGTAVLYPELQVKIKLSLFT